MSANAMFVDWMRSARKRAGLSQQQLGAALSVAQATISRIEAGGQPVTLDEAEAIARHFGANLDGILAGLPPQETATDLARARRLLAEIRDVIDKEIVRDSSD